MVEKDFDIRDLPSWKYMGWGILNGIFLGIYILHKIDISNTGIISQILEAIKPLYESTGFSTGWISSLIIILGILGLISLGIEIFAIWKKGWIPIIIAFLGFLSIFLIILNINWGIWIFITGILMVLIFPDK